MTDSDRCVGKRQIYSIILQKPECGDACQLQMQTVVVVVVVVDLPYIRKLHEDVNTWVVYLSVQITKSQLRFHGWLEKKEKEPQRKNPGNEECT